MSASVHASCNPVTVLRYASEALRASKSLVLLAVQAKPRSFQFASEQLKDDKGGSLPAASKTGGTARETTGKQQKPRRFQGYEVEIRPKHPPWQVCCWLSWPWMEAY